MPPEERDARVHDNLQEEVDVRADDPETRCGTCRVEAYDRAGFPGGDSDTPGVEELMVEGVELAL